MSANSSFASDTVDSIRDIYTITRLNLETRELLESAFPPIWVEGELSNLAMPRSGHMYFTLKDAGAQVRCAMFRMNNRRLEFEPVNGQQVLAQARVSLYPERGEFQLIVQYMEEAGAGALRRAFDALKARLAAEGLFEAERKLPIPTLPARIGVITSPTGAAIRDILSVLERRFPAIPIRVFPVQVQGEGASASIVHALERANSEREKQGACEVLILARGGGSLEDLWAFNEEPVARAIAASQIPIVSGVGHEVDFTIADFVADQRAATPSAAAELVSPDGEAWLAHFQALEQRIIALFKQRLRGERQTLEWLVRRLPDPRRRIGQQRDRERNLKQRLHFLIKQELNQHQKNLSSLESRLQARHPMSRLNSYQMRRSTLQARLDAAFKSKLERGYMRLRRNRERLLTQHPKTRLGSAASRFEQVHSALQRALRQRLNDASSRLKAAQRTLDAIGPQRTLERGYAIITRLDPDRREAQGALVMEAGSVASRERLKARFAQGTIEVEAIRSVED